MVAGAEAAVGSLNSNDSRRICSAVIWMGAGARFLGCEIPTQERSSGQDAHAAC